MRPKTYVTENKENYLSSTMSISFCLLKHPKLPIPVTIWHIVYIYMTAILPNLISLTALLLSLYLHGCNSHSLMKKPGPLGHPV